MKNKVLISWGLWLALLFVSSCSSEKNKLPKKVAYHLAKENVYKDKKGELYFRIENDPPFSEKYDGGPYEKYSYLEEIYVHNKIHSLRNIIDLESLEKLGSSGVYYKDKNYVYIFPVRSGCAGGNHFALQSKNIKFLDSDKYYLKTSDNVYYNGNRIDDLDINTAKYVVWPVPKHKKTIRLIKDKSRYYYGGEKLTVDLICRTRFSTSVRKEIIEKILGKRNGKLINCNQY